MKKTIKTCMIAGVGEAKIIFYDDKPEFLDIDFAPQSAIFRENTQRKIERLHLDSKKSFYIKEKGIFTVENDKITLKCEKTDFVYNFLIQN